MIRSFLLLPSAAQVLSWVRVSVVSTTLCLIVGAGPCLGAESNVLRFEVASIKPVEVSNPRLAEAMDFGRNATAQIVGLPIRGRRVDMRAYTLAQLIAAAFRVPTRLIVGPNWLSENRFNVEAVVAPDAPIDQANEMLQTLLKERFGLRSSNKTREQAGYILSVRKGGPTFKVSSSRGTSSGAEPPSADSIGQRARKPGAPDSMRYEYKRCSMRQFAETLSGLLQTTVEDRTGLTENYDVALDIKPPIDSADRDPQPRILDAVRKLGLDIKGGKVTFQVMLVESIQRVPTPN